MPVEELTFEDSILADVRAACYLERDDDSYDNQLIPLINTQLTMAHQFGVGPSGFYITGVKETWNDWLGEHLADLMSIKTWVGFQVYLMFDPPESSSVLKAYQDTVAKIEWMLREKSEEKGYVKDYVPEKASFYTSVASEYEEED